MHLWDYVENVGQREFILMSCTTIWIAWFYTVSCDQANYEACCTETSSRSFHLYWDRLTLLILTRTENPTLENNGKERCSSSYTEEPTQVPDTPDRPSAHMTVHILSLYSTATPIPSHWGLTLGNTLNATMLGNLYQHVGI